MATPPVRLSIGGIYSYHCPQQRDREEMILGVRWEDFMRDERIWIICAVILTMGFACNANANTITFSSVEKPKNESPTTVQTAAQIVLGNPNLIDAFRAEAPSNLSGTNSFGTFAVTGTPNAVTGETETIQFSLNPGFVLAGIFVFGGNLGGNFYSVNNETAGSLEGPVNAPFAGKSGQFACFSHIDFFVERAALPLPDGGTTLMMFSGALVGLGALRSYLKT